MECPNCHQPVEAGAVFCGNCGHQLQATQPPPTGVNQTGPNSALPSYAVATPEQKKSETRTLLVIIAGVLGIVGSLLFPLIGIVLGIGGLIAQSSLPTNKQVSRRIAVVMCGLAVIAGLINWAWAYQHDPNLHHNTQATKTPATSVTADLNTSCYTANLADRLNVSLSSVCNSTAFNGQTLDTSTDAYKIYASKGQVLSTASFTNLAKQAIEKDVRNNLPGFIINNEQVTGFAGSPSYDVNAVNKSAGVALVEAAVYHQVKNGDNIFVLVHAVSGGSADLKILEAQWQWK